MMQGMSPILAPSLVRALPGGLVAHYQQAIDHLEDEASLVAAYAQILKSLTRAEVKAHSGMPELQSLLEAWPAVTAACDRWRQDRALGNREAQTWISSSRLTRAGLLTQDAQSLLFALAFRLSCVVQRIPSPIALDSRLNGQSFTGINLLRYSITLLETYNAISSHDLARLPAYHHFQVVVSISVQLRAFSYMRKTGGDWFKDQEHTVDSAVRRVREDVGGSAARMLEMTDEQYTMGQPAQDMDFETLFGGLPDGWLDAFSINNDWTSISTNFAL
jgi:hypothetical protein